MKQKIIFMLGIIITIVATIIRLSARSIAWPQEGAHWSTQIEATSFYARQLAISDISNIFLIFGLVLVASVIISTSNKNKS